MLSHRPILPGLARPIELDASAERRRENRTPCGALPALLRTESTSLPAQVLDISNSGVCVRLGSRLPVGTSVTLCFSNTIASGNVRYCRANPDQTFDAGLQVEDVLIVA